MTNTQKTDVWFELQPKEIAALKLFTSKEHDCVYFSATNKMLRVFATNGHAVLAIVLPEDRFKSDRPCTGRVPMHCFKDFKKSDIVARIFVERKAGRAVCIRKKGDNVETTFEITDATIPDLNRVIPEKVSFESAIFDPKYMVLFQKAAALLSDKNYDPYPIPAYNGSGPALVSLQCDDRAFGLIMPLDYSEDEIPKTAPEWFKARWKE